MLDEPLGMALKDNVKARQLMADGTYVHVAAPTDSVPVRSQLALLELARRSTSPPAEPVIRHVASPLEKAPPGPSSAA